MATYFSEHYAAASTSAVAPPSTLPDPRTKSDNAGRVAATVKRMMVSMDFTLSTLANGDEVRFFTMKSGDRPISISLSAAWNAAVTCTFDLGLYAPGFQHSGAEIDDDLFATDVSMHASVNAQTEVFIEAALVNEDRGRTLWELLGETSDPLVDYDVVGTFVSLVSVTPSTLVLECEYHPADRN